MDFGTLAGLIIGLAVVTAAISTGSNLWIFFNLPGFLIVIGGTFAATMVKFPISGVFVALPVGFKAAFVNEKGDARDFIKQAIYISKKVRKSGHMAVEKIKVRNSFLKKACN